MSNRAKTKQRETYLQWLDMSPQERADALMPKDENGFSAKYKVSKNTLRKWYKAFHPEPEFDIRRAFIKDQEKIWKSFMDAVQAGKINAQALRTFAQIANMIVEKREETHKFELTPDARIAIAIQLRDSLRREYEDTGICSVCHRPKLLRQQVCVDTEPEYGEDREVAAVAVPA